MNDGVFAEDYTRHGLNDQEYADIVHDAEDLLGRTDPRSIKNTYTDDDIEAAALVLSFCKTEEVPIWWARMCLADENHINRNHKLASVMFEKAHQRYWKKLRDSE